MFKEFNARLSNSKLFWSLIGTINAINFGISAASEHWWSVAGAAALMGWAMYELYRIDRLNKENDNGGS